VEEISNTNDPHIRLIKDCCKTRDSVIFDRIIDVRFAAVSLIGIHLYSRPKVKQTVRTDSHDSRQLFDFLQCGTYQPSFNIIDMHMADARIFFKVPQTVTLFFPDFP